MFGSQALSQREIISQDFWKGADGKPRSFLWQVFALVGSLTAIWLIFRLAMPHDTETIKELNKWLFLIYFVVFGLTLGFKRKQ